MANITVGVHDIYGEIMEHCDKEIDRFTRKVNKRVWKNRARRKREARRTEAYKRK